MVNNKTFNIVLIGALSAAITAAKLTLSFIPNVELVSFLIVVYTVVFGFKRSLIITLIFVTTEVLIYGFGTWILGYYFIWPLLVILVTIFKPYCKNEYHYAVISGAFGLMFGLLFAIYESLYYGFSYGLSYWIQGISFDIIHMVSNYIVMIILFKPVSKILSKLYKGV